MIGIHEKDNRRGPHRTSEGSDLAELFHARKIGGQCVALPYVQAAAVLVDPCKKRFVSPARVASLPWMIYKEAASEKTIQDDRTAGSTYNLVVDKCDAAVKRSNRLQ